MSVEDPSPGAVPGVQQQAGEWFARLRMRECTDIDRAAFRRWLNESPVHAEAYRRVERVWERVGALKGRSPAIEAATRQALRRRAPPWRRIGAARRRQVLVAAVLVAAIGISMLSVLGTSARPGAGWASVAWAPAAWMPGAWAGERFVTTTAQQRRIALTDGSTVLLDAESELRVRYDENARHLTLARGQAQFQVTRDPRRPFVVRAADGEVRAIGTEFQVRLDDVGVLVTLLEGKVSVDVPGVLGGLIKPAQTQVLEAGQQLRYGATREPLEREPADVEVAQAWTQGDLVFKRWPLDALVNEMNRHTDIKIRIDDPALRELRVNGRFRAGDQQSLILALRHQWSIDAQRLDDEIVLSRVPASS